MRSCLKAITKLLPPPASPYGLDWSWDRIERAIGLPLPDDYKAFIDLYGTGQVRSAEGWALIWNFRDASLFGPSLANILTGPDSVVQFYRRQMNGTNFDVPFPLYPEIGGLLSFGSVVDVQNLNWLTTGQPNQWDVVYFDFDRPKFTRLGDSFSECLLKMLRQEYSGLDHPPSLRPPFTFADLLS